MPAALARVVAQVGHAAAEVGATAGGLSILVMEELHVLGGHRGGLVGIAGVERRGKQLCVGCADLLAQDVAGGGGADDCGGEQGQGEQHGMAPLRTGADWHGGRPAVSGR
ncbi:hypothetical protein D3C73_1177930 [compost metagenome]